MRVAYCLVVKKEKGGRELVDEVNRKEYLPELLSEGQGPQGASDLEQEQVSQDDISEPEGMSAEKKEELVETIDRINELEQLVAGKDEQLSALKQAEAEFEARVVNIGNSLSEAVAAYKDLVVQSNPEVLAELITGDSIEAVNESVSQAKALLSRVREGVEAQILLTRVPSGAPGRIAPDFSALSPREKIQYAIGKTK